MKSRLVRFGIGLVLFVVFLAGSVILQDKVVFPLLALPDDPCYYHFHDAPWWVDLFFIDHSGHLESRNMKLFVFMLALSIFLAVAVSGRLVRRIIHKKRDRIKAARNS